LAELRQQQTGFCKMGIANRMLNRFSSHTYASFADNTVFVFSGFE